MYWLPLSAVSNEKLSDSDSETDVYSSFFTERKILLFSVIAPPNRIRLDPETPLMPGIAAEIPRNVLEPRIPKHEVADTHISAGRV